MCRHAISNSNCILTSNTGISPPEVLDELKKKYSRENNITLLALLPDDPSKIRHRKLTLLKHANKSQKYIFPPELMNFPANVPTPGRIFVRSTPKPSQSAAAETNADGQKNPQIASTSEVEYI